MGLNELSALLEGVEDSGTGTEGKPLIMVVDDDRSVIESLERLLSMQYRVLTCSSAVQSLAVLSEEVSAVVLDVKMRDHDGFWASDQIRKKNAHVPIIFYSAYQDLKKPLDIINQYQPFGYVAKGKDPKLLLATLEKAIGYYKVISENKKTVEELKRLRAQLQKLKRPST
jgi:DNA-binding NtrC family response regulator